MPDVVALPGTFCPPAVFDRLAATLGTPIDVWSWLTRPGPWDIPSLAADLASHLDQAYRAPVLLIGHSTGGAIALQLALTRPELAHTLVLVDTGAHMRGHGDVENILRALRAGPGPELLAAVLDRSFHTPLEPALRAEWLAWAGAVPPPAAHDVLASQHALDLRPRLAEVRVPTLVLHGLHDQARGVEYAEELAHGIPGARLHLLPTGHTPIHEAPELVAEVVRAARIG